MNDSFNNAGWTKLFGEGEHEASIRFNTKHEDTGLYWRVINKATNEEVLATHVESIAAFSTELGIVDNVLKGNICIKGLFFKSADGVVKIVSGNATPLTINAMLSLLR